MKDNKDGFSTLLENMDRMKQLKEIFVDAPEKEEKADKLDRLLDGAIDIIKELAPKLIPQANNPILGGMVRNQISHHPEFDTFLSALKDPDQKDMALDALYSSAPKDEVDKFLVNMGLSEYIR